MLTRSNRSWSATTIFIWPGDSSETWATGTNRDMGHLSFCGCPLPSTHPTERSPRARSTWRNCMERASCIVTDHPAMRSLCPPPAVGTPRLEHPTARSPRALPRDLWRLLQMVYPGGILAGDLGLLLLRALRQNLLQDLLRPWEGRFDMRIIGAPQEIVHADDVPQLDPQAIFLEAIEHVAVEVVAGQHGLLKPVAVLLDSLSVRVVDPVQEMGDPGQLHLHRPNVQLRMALKDPAEDHVAKRHADPVIRIGEEGGTHAIGLLPHPKFLADPWPIGGDVEAQRYLQVLGCRPEGFVLWQIVSPALGGIHRDQASRKPQLG